MTGLFAIHDTMQYVAPDVATICVGQACSAAAVLLAAGAPGKRSALPNARVLIHQPHGGAQGQSTDIELAVAEMVEMRERMVDILVTATGQTRERIVADIDRDYIVRGEDAVAYGLVDQIIERRQLAVPTVDRRLSAIVGSSAEQVGWPAARLGGARPRCVNAAGIATRPRGVRAISPCWIRNGS